MNSLYFMIPLALILMALAVVIFIWALRSGQFEDLDGPAMSVVMDEDQTLTAEPEDEPVKIEDSEE